MSTPVITVDQLIERMQSRTTYNINGGVEPPNAYTAVQMPFNQAFWNLVYPPRNGTLHNRFDSFAAWFWVYLGQGNSAVGKLLEVRRYRAAMLLDSPTGQWWDYGVGTYTKSAAYGQAWQGKTQYPGGDPNYDSRVQAVSNESLGIGPLTGTWGIELWADGFYTRPGRALVSRAVANAWVAECRVINQDGSPYTWADAKFTVGHGYDPYDSTRSGVPSGIFTGYYVNAADGANCGWKEVNGSMGWVPVGGVTISGVHKSYTDGPPAPFGNWSGGPGSWLGDDPPYVLTPQQLRNNPPPFATTASVAPPPPAPPPPLSQLVCTPWAIQRAGDAFAENNTWGSAGVSGWSQCIELTTEPAGARLRTTFNWPETPSAPNEVKGFPTLVWGAKPGFGPRPSDPSWQATTPGTRLPLRVSDVRIFRSHARLLNTSSLTGKGQITWDMWVQSSDVHTDTFGDAPITHEIMVQLRATGGYAVPPNIGGTSLGTFTTQGYTFWVYATPVLTWQMTRFIPQISSGSAIEGELDFMPFLDHLVSIGRVQSAHWLMSAELGYEPEYGTGDYTIYEARFDADERTNPTGGSMPVSVSATGIDINAIMAAALALSVGSQKSKYNTDVIAAIGSNPTVHLLRNGVEVYRDSVVGSLSQSGGAIVLPASLDEPPEATFVADIDTGTWVMEIRNAGNPAVKLSVPVGPSGTADVLTLDQDLDATRPVKFSSVQFQPPATLDVSLGGGGGGELGDLSANAGVERIINQMTTMNDRPLLGITDRANQPWWGKSEAALQAAGRSTNASAVQGARPRYQNMSTYYRSVYRIGRDEQYALNIRWPNMLAWAVFVTGGTPQDAPGVGHTASNTGVRLYPVNAWGLLPNGMWEKFMNNIPLGTPGSVNFYDNEGFTYVRAPAESRAGPGNSTEILIPPRQLMADRGAHPYGQQIVAIDEYRYSAVFYLTACQLIRWNAGLADDRADADILIQTSADWYTNPQSVWKNADITWWPGACTPKFTSVVSELRYFGGASVFNGINDNLGEGMITVEQLRNNPPPIPAWS